MAFERAGLPPNLLTTLHLTPELTSQVIKDPRVNFVSFTGSVRVGKIVEQTAAAASESGVFKGVGLEVSLSVSDRPYKRDLDCSPFRRKKLGGKDAAYVRPDADFDYTVAELVDGEKKISN